MAESNRVQGARDEFASAADGKVQKEARGDPLVALLQAGRPEALACLYTRYYREMLVLARRYMQDLAVAEDLVQDTWTAIIEGIEKFKGKCSFKTWAFKILSNKAKSKRRRECRLSAIKLLLGLQSERSKNTQFRTSVFTNDRVDRWSTTPEELMLAQEFREEMHKFVASLPPRQYQVYVLRDIEGWSPESICDFLGISNGSQRVLLHRARSAIYEWYSARTRGRASNSAPPGEGFMS
ncbi:MAG TPA: RNA polymerase sigma factor [Terriglobia bacterium]|nr:RNA polymerase sigma factor [Terriglobia bacterium]